MALTLSALIILAAGCTVRAKPPEDPCVEGYDPNSPRAPYNPKAAVQIVSIADGGWNVGTDPRLKWTVSPDVIGAVGFVSVRIFEVVGGEAATEPCVTIDDTLGALAGANGRRLFEPIDGVLVSFVGSHAGAKELKPATNYMLVLTLTGTKGQEQATVRFTTR